MLTRRQMLKGLAAFTAGGTTFGGYALAEPFRLGITRYAISPPRWPTGLGVRVAIIADLHVCEPWMSLPRLTRIVARTNATNPDCVLLLGDFVAGRGISRFSRPIPHDDWAAILNELQAPCGVHAVLGNHDWWEDVSVQRRRRGPTPAGEALRRTDIRLYENDAVRFEKDGHGFWIAGLADQWAFWPRPENYAAFKMRGKRDYEGLHDVGGTLAKVTDNAPVVLMVHEPDIFPEVPSRVSLTVAGHTHGGQVNLFGYKPIVPSRFGRRYAYGHIVEEERHLVVSAGLGCSGLPVRFGAPPEVVVIDIGQQTS